MWSQSTFLPLSSIIVRSVTKSVTLRKHWKFTYSKDIEATMPQYNINLVYCYYSPNNSKYVKFHYFPLLGSNFQSPEELLQFVTKSTEGSTFECTLCSNFRAVRKGLVRNHLESIHFPGVFSYSCHLCNRQFQGRNALAVHKSAVHPNKAKVF